MLIPSSPDRERRIVLIDLDWQEADLLPRLLRQPGLDVSLVAGENVDSAGVRAAELCGLRRTVELADLTREIFDLALVGEHSLRRAQVVRLLTALGTPVESPLGFLELAKAANGHGNGNGNGNGHAPEELPPSALGEIPSEAMALDRMLEQAIPDVSGAVPIATPQPHDAAPVPPPGDREALARQLALWVASSGSSSALLSIGTTGSIERLCSAGGEDPLLEALAKLAADEEAPVILGRLDGSGRGKTWGAWPLRTRRHRGVLAAAGFDPVEGRAAWEQAAQGLRVAWEEGERDPSSVSPGAAWLDRGGFAARIEGAVALHRGEATPFVTLRLRFDSGASGLDQLCERLPARMRSGDALCRPNPTDLLILHDGTTQSFAHVRRRIAALWEESWRASGRDHPAPTPAEERIDLTSPAHAETFLGTIRRWLS